MDTQTFPFEIKSITEVGVIEGVVSAFGGVDHQGDTIERGAYTKSLAQIEASGRKLPVLYQHDPRRPIGVWADLRETKDALIGRAELAMEVRDAQEAYALAKRGALTGISIGYKVMPNGARHEGGRRILTDVGLWEASLVTFPSDPQARVTSIKSITSAKDIADLLHEAGLSGRKAKAAAGAAWRAINEPDEAADPELAALVLAATARLRKEH